MPAAHAEIANELVIHSYEHGVRFNRKDDVDLCLGLEAIRKLARHTIGVLRVPQPNIIRQKREPRRSQKTHFRAELPGLFEPVIKFD